MPPSPTSAALRPRVLPRALGSDPSSYANSLSSTPSASATPLSPLSSNSIGLSPTVLAWAGVTVAAGTMIILFLWRVSYVRSRFSRFPPGDAPAFTLSYILKSFLLPPKGLHISALGIHVKAPPAPPEPVELPPSYWSHLIPSRRFGGSQRLTTGEDIGEGGRRRGEIDVDDDVELAQVSTTTVRAELPAYEGRDRRLPDYSSDSVWLHNQPELAPTNDGNSTLLPVPLPRAVSSDRRSSLNHLSSIQPARSTSLDLHRPQPASTTTDSRRSSLTHLSEMVSTGQVNPLVWSPETQTPFISSQEHLQHVTDSQPFASDISCQILPLSDHNVDSNVQPSSSTSGGGVLSVEDYDKVTRSGR